MTLQNLCQLLQLPNEVIQEVEEYHSWHKNLLGERMYEQLKNPECWEQTIAQMKEEIGQDLYGFGILAELLACACKTYEEYRKRGIPDSVFISTMKFCTRFINEHKRINGYYAL